MPKYIANQHDVAGLEPQQQLADGRWTPIARVVEMDTDAGYAVVLQAQGDQLVIGAGGQPIRQRVQGAFRMVGPAGEVNPVPAGPTTATVEPAPRPESPPVETATADEPVNGPG